MSPKTLTASVGADAGAGESDKSKHHGGHGGDGNTSHGVIPFKITGKQASRNAFATVTASLGTSPTNQLISIQPTGFVRFINLEVTLTASGGTPAFNADAPFNLLAAIELRNSAGNDLIPPVTGYQLYLMNKYGCQFAAGPYADTKNNRQFSASLGSAHFFLQIPLEIDPSTGYGAIPSLAANRTYMLSLTFNTLSAVYSSAPTTASVTVNATTYYWAEPDRNGPHGMEQATHPVGVGTTVQWQIEQPSVNPGDRKVKSNNVGNLIRAVIFTIRNSSGARIDVNGVPALSEIYLDNAPLFYLTNTEWEYLMATTYGLTNGSKDAAAGLDTGVYVLPFFAMTDRLAGIGAGHRGQYLQTLDTSLLEIRGSSWGSAISGLEILTQSVVPSADKHEAGGAVAAFYGRALQHH